MSLPAPTRWVLIGLISIGLQLCCCNAEALLGGCCQNDSEVEATNDGCQVSGGHDHSDGHDHGSHHADRSDHDKDHNQPEKSGGPCNHDGGGCSCGTHDKVPSHVEKLDLPVTVVAILPAPVDLTPVLDSSAPRYAGLHGVFPIRTTLLQQHCALTV